MRKQAEKKKIQAYRFTLCLFCTLQQVSQRKSIDTVHRVFEFIRRVLVGLYASKIENITTDLAGDPLNGRFAGIIPVKGKDKIFDTQQAQNNFGLIRQFGVQGLCIKIIANGSRLFFIRYQKDTIKLCSPIKDFSHFRGQLFGFG
jgi:hypothetical protein